MTCQHHRQSKRKIMMQWTIFVIALLQTIYITESFSIRTAATTTNTVKHHAPPVAIMMYQHRKNHQRVLLSYRHSVPLTRRHSYHCNRNLNRDRLVYPLFHTLDNSSSSSSINDDNEKQPPTYGGLLGRITGLSLTAIRQSIRTTTGLSLTATRTALRGLTGVSVTAFMKSLFGIFPPWFRYFLQPFFIMYYTPLMIIKYFIIGSTKTSKEEAFASHEKIIEGWKDAIRAAEVAQGYWPLHVTEDGMITATTSIVESSSASLPMTDVIVESLDIASTVRNQKNQQETEKEGDGAGDGAGAGAGDGDGDGKQ